MKYALVTGGSRGIGRAVCQRLAKMGLNILINYTSNDQAANETAELVKKHGVDALLMKFDVADKTQVDQTLVKWIEEHPEH